MKMNLGNKEDRYSYGPFNHEVQIKKVVEVLKGLLPWQYQLTLLIADETISVHDRLFWHKFKAFMSGNYKELTQDDCRKLASKLCEEEENDSFFRRMISYIDQVDCDEKAVFLNNVVRAFLNEEIVKYEMFLIYHAVVYTPYEDLLYLKQLEERHASRIPYSINIISLNGMGLVLPDSIDGGDFEYRPFIEYQRFAISELGKLTCKHALYDYREL